MPNAKSCGSIANAKSFGEEQKHKKVRIKVDVFLITE